MLETILETTFKVLQKPFLQKSLYKCLPIVHRLKNTIPLVKIKDKDEGTRLLKEKQTRVLRAIFMKREPDRVPFFAAMNFFPAHYAGISCAEFMFDYEKNRFANLKTCQDFDIDLTFHPFSMAVGKVFMATGIRIIRMPGRELSHNSMYQFNEAERLKQDEYDEFLNGTSKFLADKVLPDLVDWFKFSFGKKIQSGGRIILEGLKHFIANGKMEAEYEGLGYYGPFGGAAFPPFDLMSFFFRDLTGVTKDLFSKKYQGKLLESIERLERIFTPIFLTLPEIFGQKFIFFPSERAFSLSPSQFEKFYWPSLKRLIIKFVENGNIPFLAWESDATHLAHFLLELPKRISRHCVFQGDASDILKVDKVLDGHMCITGNVPISTLCVGTPKDVEKYCDQIFPTMKENGGYMLSPALQIPEQARPENVKAMIDYCHKHGQY